MTCMHRLISILIESVYLYRHERSIPYTQVMTSQCEKSSFVKAAVSIMFVAEA